MGVNKCCTVCLCAHQRNSAIANNVITIQCSAGRFYQTHCLEVFCNVPARFFFAYICVFAYVCVYSLPARTVAYDPLISALSCMASRDTLTPTSTELWPHTFLPWALLTPSLCPFHSSRPAFLPLSFSLPLSFFCVSTDVWNYSGMEGWIPPWWAERRREPFVQ